ncbi:MAG TPA: 3-oxoacyl-[acyl-carrier-protein] synthase III C-terminal domain-containing protein [Acidimicrobiales bacterium]|nr:3-oxoacyl-[acyl-carrier-protein] synthase III C-terminal domain-containing protein [Acidimicrobiales bacterium]
MSAAATIRSVATCVPAPRRQQDLWEGFFREHFRDVKWAERIYRSAGPVQRHPAVDPTAEDISRWTTEARMRRYLVEAMPLAKGAASRALSDGGSKASDVGLLAVVSCTGYSTPGLDIFLARDLGLPADAERLAFGHMGCHAALPALGIVSDWVSRRQRPALLVSVELSSLHLQPRQAGDAGGAPPDEVLAHALFSDAAAAALIAPGNVPNGAGSSQGVLTGATPGLELVALEASTDFASACEITWEITGTGFRMGLGRTVPQVVGAHVGPTVERLLGRCGLRRDDVSAWGAHPGGTAILDAVAKALCLSPADMAPSRLVLEQSGNCSSATILLVLQEVVRSRRLEPGDHVVLLGFGPGLTIYAALLSVSGPAPD